MPAAHADTIASLLKTPFYCPLVAYLPAEAQNVHQQIIHGTSSQFPALTALLAAITRQDRDIFDGAGHSEDDFHALWDDIIRNTLHLLNFNCQSLEVEMTRNRIDIYDSGVLKNQARPDFLCYIRKALVLRGEEKEDSTLLDTAQEELVAKFGEWSPMFYGQLPFVLGYATGGLKIKYVRTDAHSSPIGLTLNSVFFC